MVANLAKTNLVFVFDLDGTLVDTAKTTHHVLSGMIEARGGKPQSMPPIANLLSFGGEVLIKSVLGPFSNQTNDDLIEFRQRLLQIPIPEADIYSGIKHLLQILIDKKYVLAVCTNKPQILAEKTLADVGLKSLFSCIVGSTSSIEKKPDIAMLTKIKRILGCRMSDLVLIGDSEVDQETAHNARIPYVHFLHGYGELRSDISQPFQISKEIDETAFMYFSGLKASGLNRS